MKTLGISAIIYIVKRNIKFLKGCVFNYLQKYAS